MSNVDYDKSFIHDFFKFTHDENNKNIIKNVCYFLKKQLGILLQRA
jgi:hypothetical protein